jgi:hypothetical protein
MRLWPVWDGVKVALHEPALRVHDAAGVNVPVEFELNVTVPVGVTAPVPDASATVAVQVDGEPLATDAGEHETVVEEARMVEDRRNVPLLPECTELPL